MSDAPTSLLHDAPLRAATTRHEEMMVEARRIIDAGNDRGLGYLENTTVITATLSSQRQYFKRAHSVESHAHMHKRAHFAPPVTGPPPLDHVDVFLDWMKMDHEIDFRDRLDINTYAIDPADLFLSKLQIQKLNEKDAHDVIALAQGDHVVRVLLVELLDLQFAEKQIRRVDGVGVDVQTVAKVDLVIHLHPIEEDVHMVEGRGARNRRGEVRPLVHVGVGLDAVGALEVLPLAGERGRDDGGVVQVTEAAIVAGVDDAPRLDHHLLVAGGGRPQRSVVKEAGRGVAHRGRILPGRAGQAETRRTSTLPRSISPRPMS